MGKERKPRSAAGAPRRWIEAHVAHYGEECLTWPFATDNQGRATINLKAGDRYCPQRVARIMCERRWGKPPTPEHEAAHTCGKGHLGCVNPAHVVWKTHAENMADTTVHGTSTRGERCSTAKFSRDEVKRIRNSHLRNGDLAKHYSVSPSTISRIKSGENWGWLS